MQSLNVLREHAKCLCMFHWGETAQVECSISPDITRMNRQALAA